MVTIRTMQRKDCKAVSELEKKIFSQPWSEQGFLDAVDREDTIFLVAEEKETVLGYLGMYRSCDEGEITNVAVDFSYRKKGIGSLLLQKALQEATMCGVAKVVLEVRVSNQEAIHLYEKIGFKSCGVRKGFYDFPKEDAYIMLFHQ